jgi:HEAT repeat protein
MFSLLVLCFSIHPQAPAAPTVEEAVAEIVELLDSGADDLDMARAYLKLAVIDDSRSASALGQLLPRLLRARPTAVLAMEHCKGNYGTVELKRLVANSLSSSDRTSAASVLVKTSEGRLWLLKKYSKLIDLNIKVMLMNELERGKLQDRLVHEEYKARVARIQGAALHTGARLGLVQTKKAAFKGLESGQVEIKVGAIYACGIWGGAKGFEKLARCVPDAHDPRVLASLWHSLRLAVEEDEVEAIAKVLLKTRKKNDQSFLANALIVAGWSQPIPAGEAFTNLLKKSDSDLRSIALRGIEATAYEEALPLVIKLLRNKNELVRADAFRALSTFSSVPDKQVETIIKMSRDKDSGVRLSATMAFKLLPQEIATPLFGERLGDDVWSVQDVAVEALAEMRTLAATRLLAAHMDQAEGLVRSLTYRHLRELTGQDFGMAKSSWIRWLDSQPANFQLPNPGQAQEMLLKLKNKRDADDTKYGSVEYHDIAIQSGGAIFIFDQSASMGQKYTATEEVFLDHFANKLAKTIRQLRDDHSFNIILFSDDAKAWKPSLTQATDAAKKEAVGYILQQRSKNTTRLDKAIELAFRDPDVQQIYIMTDGDPSGGEHMKAKIIDRVTELNRSRRIRIHTIVAGDVHGEFLTELARINGGTSVDLRN